MYGSKITQLVTKAIFFGICLALVACQQNGMDSVRSNFQSKSDAKLERLTFLYGGAFIRGAKASPRGFREVAQATFLFPYGASYSSGIPYSQNYNYDYQYSGQQQQFTGQPLQALQQLEMILRDVKKTRATYYFTMVAIHRWLSMALHDKNFMMTWMSQQYGSYGTGYEGYNLSYPAFQPYNGQSQQYSQANQFAQQGYQEGQ